MLFRVSPISIIGRKLMELVINDPAVLVVDEPYVFSAIWKGRSLTCSTSGLDASIALSVMQVLRDIAATGRTVIGELNDTSMRHPLMISYYPPTSK